MKYILANLALWTITLLATMLFLGVSAGGVRMAPLIAICMIGSTLLMRRAQAGPWRAL
jgi:hypothetical protein